MKKSLFLLSFKFKHRYYSKSLCLLSWWSGPKCPNKDFLAKTLDPQIWREKQRCYICFSYSAFSCSELTAMEVEQTGRCWAPALAAAARWAELLGGGSKAVLRWHQAAGMGSSKRSRLRLQGATAGPPWTRVPPERCCLATTTKAAVNSSQGLGWKREMFGAALLSAECSTAQPAPGSWPSVLRALCITKRISCVFRSSAAVLKQVPCWENKYKKHD